MAIFLVRHPATIHNGPTEAQGKVRAGGDAPLSAHGQAQQTRLAAFFKGKPIAHVYASDTSRAGDTGQAIATATGAQLHLHPGLRPWHGAAPGQDLKTATPLLQHLYHHPQEVGPGGESYQQFFERFLPAIKGMLHPGAAIVTHGRNIKTLWSLLRGGGKLSRSFPPHDPSPTRPGDVYRVGAHDLTKVFDAGGHR